MAREINLGCSVAVKGWAGSGIGHFDTPKELIQATNNWRTFGGQETEQTLQKIHTNVLFPQVSERPFRVKAPPVFSSLFCLLFFFSAGSLIVLV